jgi:hypothetical protein
VKTDPHSPGEFRVNGPLSNLDEFFAAFDVPEGAPMRRAAADRVESGRTRPPSQPLMKLPYLCSGPVRRVDLPRGLRHQRTWTRPPSPRSTSTSTRMEGGSRRTRSRQITDSWGAFDELQNNNEMILHGIVEKATGRRIPASSRSLWATSTSSGMDVATVDAAVGLARSSPSSTGSPRSSPRPRSGEVATCSASGSGSASASARSRTPRTAT